MMNQRDFKILANTQIAESVYKMELEGDTSAITTPGQFVEIELPGRFLRRPISVCDSTEGLLTLIYKTVGVGTKEMSRMNPGESLNLLCGLGHGFTVDNKYKKPVLIGGGVGVPPLFKLAKCWLTTGVSPTIILGFNKEEEIMLADDFTALGLKVIIATIDGSRGIKGFVTDALDSLTDSPDYFQACGPLPMLKALGQKLNDLEGEYSLEERMGCGFGACMGCSIHTTEGAARVCTDGPVFRNNLIDWNLL